MAKSSKTNAQRRHCFARQKVGQHDSKVLFPLARLDACLSQPTFTEQLSDYQPPDDLAEIERAIVKLDRVYALFDDELDADDDHIFQLAAIHDPHGQQQRGPGSCALDDDDDEVLRFAALDDPRCTASPKQSPQHGTSDNVMLSPSVSPAPATRPPTSSANPPPAPPSSIPPHQTQPPTPSAGSPSVTAAPALAAANTSKKSIACGSTSSEAPAAKRPRMRVNRDDILDAVDGHAVAIMQRTCTSRRFSLACRHYLRISSYHPTSSMKPTSVWPQCTASW
ncbi:hypothetical protein BCR44DRAFT_1013190 [Catenaria anguillulae PL171]|uniref:Uncharacterized protein n=1 Tax=Catenaria anguillulae PL171 TaxID=765915 RepID=A0A1Y2I4D6_9FUNG|nr:hypothetical protein BCR44DRAFT_1013190 [Catenaria anguillulae PL171]